MELSYSELQKSDQMLMWNGVKIKGRKEVSSLESLGLTSKTGRHRR